MYPKSYHQEEGPIYTVDRKWQFGFEAHVSNGEIRVVREQVQ